MFEPVNFNPPVTNEELEEKLTQLEATVGGLEIDLKEFREQMERRFDAIEDALNVVLRALEKQDGKLDSIEIFVSDQG